MYDEVMQLIALAKNDEQYFKRIEELKKKQLEVAHVLEIAETLKDADMHLAKARQEATEILDTARKEAEEIKSKASEFVAEAKAVAEKSKTLQKELKERAAEIEAKKKELEVLEKEKQVSIDEHHKLSVDRGAEQDAARKVKNEFETKLKKMREIALS